MSGDFCELIKKGIEVLIKEDFMGKGIFCVLDIPQTKNKVFIEAEKSAMQYVRGVLGFGFQQNGTVQITL